MSRIVNFPPVQSFGHLDLDKWLAQKVLEEAAEFTVAAKEWIKARDNEAFPRHIVAIQKDGMIDEYADVLQTLANWAVAIGLSDEDIEDAMLRCMERNRARGRMDGDES